MDMYIRKYYPQLLSCSRHWCSVWGIPGEAYDLLADALCVLCCKPENILQDLIRHELAGEKKLFFYTRKVVYYEIAKYGSAAKSRFLCTLNEAIGVPDNSGAPEISDERFARSREVEALTRSDDYTVGCGGCGAIRRVVTYSGRKPYPCVRYYVRREDGARRSFSCLSAATAYLTSPPRMSIMQGLAIELRIYSPF